MREVGIVPVLPGGPVEVVRRNLAPELTAMPAEGNAAQERGPAGEFQQAIDAARSFRLSALNAHRSRKSHRDFHFALL